MRKAIMALAIAAIALFAGYSNALAEATTGDANLHQIDQSGVAGRMEYTDTGSMLTVNGTATGLTFGQRYASLFYDNGSVPSGPTACAPTNNSVSFAQMFIGFWAVKADGTGSLHAVKTGLSYVALDKVHTQSIRHVISLPPGPLVVPVVACGDVHDIA